MVRTVALYTRVSTIGQSCAAQEQELREVAARSGRQITAVYMDHRISGAFGPGTRRSSTLTRSRCSVQLQHSDRNTRKSVRNLASPRESPATVWVPSALI